MPWSDEHGNERVPRDGQWRTYAEGYDNYDYPYLMCIMRLNTKHWGDISMRYDRKKEVYRVRIDFSIEGKRKKETFESDSQAQADLAAEGWMEQYGGIACDNKNKRTGTLLDFMPEFGCSN